MTKNTFISFSGGVESTTMCVLFGNKADAIFADTGYEFDELYKRIELVENEVRKLHGNNFKIIKVNNKDFQTLPEYIEHSKYYPSYQQRFCTRMFKIEPIDYWLKQFKDDGAEIMIGLNSDEEDLRTGNHGNLPFVNYSYPLFDKGINRLMCEQILNSVNLHPNFPAYMRRGGCIGCYYKGKHEIAAMYRLNKDAYNFVMELEESIQDKRGKDFYVMGNLKMTLRKFAEKLESQPELFNSEEFYSVINNATKCGVFCNR